jgi:hypothetical protein
LNGNFEFDSLPADSPFSFHKEGYSGIENRRLPLDGQDLITVEMVPSGLILGKVVDGTTGKPIREFNVQITFSPQYREGEPSSGLLSSLVDPGQAYQSDEGRFKIGELVAGMPLQVMVSAQGYERGVRERVVAASDGAGQVEEFRLDPLDPAKMRTYRGRFLGAGGQPVVGAQLRLIASRSQPNGQAEHPFNWWMIRDGQVAREANVVRFLASSTDARGRFEYSGIPSGTEVELAWWGKGIAPGRADHLERTAQDRQGWFWVDMTLPAPARIVGAIDRKAYPAAGRVEVSAAGRHFDSSDISLKPDQVDFAFEDLAPGEYNVHLTTSFERRPGDAAGLMTRTLATAKVTVAAGETGRFDFKP